MQGRVIQSTGSFYEVLLNSGEIITCRIKGKFRLNDNKLTNPIAVGDIVDVDFDEEVSGSIIKNIHPRKNYIMRSAPHKTDHKHIIASNVDQCVVIASLLQPRTSTGFIDRILFTAFVYDIPGFVVFNKKDIYKKGDLKLLDQLIETYNSIGYSSFAASAATGENIEQIKDVLKDKISLLAGHSGVGKSSIINKIQPGLNLKTGIISHFSEKGLHTTTFAKMYKLNFRGFIIDTPGIKEFGLTDVEPEEIGHYFPEIRDRMKNCRFNNCLHINESGCAILAGVETGEIAMSRYMSYLTFYEEIKANKPW